MYPDDLAKHCRKIEREATLAIEETGANMLFLVLGFLEFPDQRDSDKSFTAPLISVPVTLLKKEVAGIQQFSLQYTGDDISENLSLREKLRNDFGLVLPELAEEQIDVNGYFAEIQEIIKIQTALLNSVDFVSGSKVWNSRISRPFSPGLVLLQMMNLQAIFILVPLLPL